MKKRILAIMMATALCVSSVPFSVYAEEMETEVVTDSEADIMENTPDEVAKQMEDAEVVTAQEDEEINVASVDEIVSANAMMEGSSSDIDSGTYKLKVNVTAAGNANYEPLTKMVMVKIKVK